MNYRPKVSIITPSYNQGEFLIECIESVLSQDYPIIEHIVVDGGSKDETVSILQRYSSQIARWVSEPDDGFADAVNKGLRMSSGEIVSILNSDDTLYSSNAITQVVAAFSDNPTTRAIIGDYVTIDEEGRVIKEYRDVGIEYSYKKLVCLELVMPQNSIFVHRDIYEKVGPFDSKVDWCADFDMWLRIGLITPFTACKSILSTYRLHKGQRNAQDFYALSNPADKRQALDKLYARKDLPDEILRIRKRAYAQTYRHQSLRMLRRKKFPDFFSSFAKYIYRKPFGILDYQIYKTLFVAIYRSF